MVSKRRAAGAKSSKAPSKEAKFSIKKKIKDAQVRRAMRIMDDYTEELWKKHNTCIRSGKPETKVHRKEE